MLLKNNFTEDPRVRNETISLIKAGYDISIIATKKKDDRFFEVVHGVNVYRVPFIIFHSEKAIKNKWVVSLKTLFGYFFEYFYFTMVCFLLSLYIFVRTSFNVVHIHNPPDVLVLIGIFYKLFGCKVVFDQHEQVSALYLSRFKSKNDFIFNTLFLIEKIYLKFSDLVISTNESYKQINLDKVKINSGKNVVVRNGPDLKETTLTNNSKFCELKKENKKIICFVGVINPQDGVDFLIRAVHYIVEKFHRTDFYCVIIGAGDSLQNLKNIATQHKIDKYIWFAGYIPHREMVPYLASADICVEPAPSDPFNKISTPIKVMEYMALKKPVVCFDLPEIRYTTQQAALYVKPNEEVEFALALINLMDSPAKRTEMGELGYKRIIEELSWHHVSKNLVEAYNRVFNL